MTVDLTDDERDLIRTWPSVIEYVVADPANGIEHLKSRQGAGNRFLDGYTLNAHHFLRKGRLVGTWQKAYVTERFGPDARPDLVGRVKRLRFDPVDREVSITLARLQAWAESLPDDIRARARKVWATDTRDLGALRRIVLEAVDLGMTVQLGLFEVA